MQRGILTKAWSVLAGLVLFPFIVQGQVITITAGSQTYSSLNSTTVNMSGQSELHLTGASPITGCQINLNSPDSWLFLEQIKPSVTAGSYLSQVRVSGAAAVLNSNVRVVQYLSGAVVIPHAPGYQPLQVYSGYSCSGTSLSLGLYTYYKGTALLGALNDAISSFKLKRGYMATLAQNEDGTGVSKVYVAQDGDMVVNLLPEKLDNAFSFVRVFPWRWVNKKGWCGSDAWSISSLNCGWSYDWDNAAVSTLDSEYIPMRHNRYWNAYSNINSKQNSTAALGFNEPDSTGQADMTVAEVLAQWPNLMASGLRLGSPATTDGGLAWLYDFIAQADALNYRVDYIAVHYYKGGWTAAQLYSWLREIHEKTGRPLWVTEFNNGANWTCCEPTLASNATTIGRFIDIMDSAPFVERYAIYNWVGATRELISGTTINPAGVVYRDNAAPMAYMQPPVESGGGCARYQFNNNAQDSLFGKNNSTVRGGAGYVSGYSGQAIDLDGADDYVELPANLGDCDDFTFAAWIYWDGGNPWQRIFDFGNGTTYYMLMTPRSGSNTLRFTISTTSFNNEQRLEAAQLASGKWVHVAVTLSGNTGKLFVNGAVVNTNTAMTINPSNINTTMNYLGKGQFLVDPLFNGRLDEVYVVNYALTDAQVAALAGGTAGNLAPVFITDPVNKTQAGVNKAFNSSLLYNVGDPDAGTPLVFSKVSGPEWLSVAGDGAVSGTPAITDAGQNSFRVRVSDVSGASDEATVSINVPGYNLLAHYKMDGTAADNLHVYDGTANGSPVYNVGRIGQAIDLDGTDDYVSLPVHLARGIDFTFAAWVYWDGGGQWQRIFDFGKGTDAYMVLTPRSGNDTLRFTMATFGGGEQQVNTTQLVSGQWVHVAVTLSGTTGSLYVNGILANTNSAMTINPVDLDARNFYLGKSQFADPYFNGRLDDVRIYNYALPAAYIAQLAGGAANNPPFFFRDPIQNQAGIEDAAYTGYSLKFYSLDLEGDSLTYGKDTGPSWLTVAANGAVAGKPGNLNSGLNTFTVRAQDAGGLSDTTSMTFKVANIYSGKQGLGDFAGVAGQWLAAGCVDTPGCNGADLDGDKDVDMADLGRMVANWLAGN